MKRQANDVGVSEDAALVARIRSGTGGNEAFERLVDKYWRLVISWIRPRVRSVAEAEDVAQESFIRAFRALKSLEDPERFMSWLLRIAKNVAADNARRCRNVQSLDRMCEDGEPPVAAPAVQEDPGDRIDRDEEFGSVLREVHRLPEKYRLVVMLRYFEGFSGSEISAILGEPEGTVRNRLFRALDKLRRQIGKSHPPRISSPVAQGTGRR